MRRIRDRRPGRDFLATPALIDLQRDARPHVVEVWQWPVDLNGGRQPSVSPSDHALVEGLQLCNKPRACANVDVIERFDGHHADERDSGGENQKSVRLSGLRVNGSSEHRQGQERRQSACSDTAFAAAA